MRAYAFFLLGILAIGLTLPAQAQQAEQSGQLQLPEVFDNPGVQTDITENEVSIFEVESQLLQFEDHAIPRENRLVERHSKYRFAPHWLRIGEARLAYGLPAGSASRSGTEVRELAFVMRGVPGRRSFREITGDVNATTMPLHARLKHSDDAVFSLDGTNLSLASGALIIEPAAGPVILETQLADRQMQVVLKRGALCLVSNIDDRVIVSNLTDRTRQSCSIVVDNGMSRKPLRLDLRAGQTWEIARRPEEGHLVAYDAIGYVPVSDNLVAELYRINYPRLLKRFNLINAIDTTTLRHVMKTAAATAHIDRQARADNQAREKQRLERSS